MANYREVYLPPDDDPPYDLRDDDYDAPRGRLPLLIVIALLVLGAFGGVVWLAYQQGIARGRAVAGGPAVIAAPQEPVRTAPEDAGGVPFTDLKIYNEPVPPDQEAETSTLASNPAVEMPDLPEPPPAPPQQTAEAAMPRLNPADSAPDAPPPAPQAPAPGTASPTSGAAMVQVGAFPSEVEALQAWSSFQEAHGTLLGNLREDIQMADLGERGVWYRVRIGPFPTRDSATTLCEQLQQDGASCFVAAP